MYSVCNSVCNFVVVKVCGVVPDYVCVDFSHVLFYDGCSACCGVCVYVNGVVVCIVKDGLFHVAWVEWL